MPFFRVASFLPAKGEYDRAISDSSQAIRLNPRSDGAFHIRAYSNLRKGDYDQAFADYSAAINVNAKECVARSKCAPNCI